MVDLCRWREIAVFLCSQQNYTVKLFLSWKFFIFIFFTCSTTFLHNQRHCYRPVRTTCSAHRNQIRNCMKEKVMQRIWIIFIPVLVGRGWKFMRDWRWQNMNILFLREIVAKLSLNLIWRKNYSKIFSSFSLSNSI